MTSAENSTSTFVTLTLEFVSSLEIRSKDIFYTVWKTKDAEVRWKVKLSEENLELAKFYQALEFHKKHFKTQLTALPLDPQFQQG